MTTVAEALPPNALDGLLQEIAPQEVHNEELVQFKGYLGKLDHKQLHTLESELKAAARVRGRKIILREQLLSRLGTDWLRKQQEVVEGELAKIEVAKDTIDFNVLELELSTQTWKLGKMTKVLRLDEQAGSDPMIDMIKRREAEDEASILQVDGGLDDDRLDSMFGVQ
ncbi:MAG: hypothetical protein HY261_03930 [Chloroflexi bacterium]|nr:hypothetical protein [Chloroflexota bacterium]